MAFEVIGRVVLDVSFTGGERWSEGLLTKLNGYSINPGGAATNVSANLAFLGEDVRLRACVGEDFAGKYLVDELTNLGVDHSSVRTAPDEQTSISLINVASGGQIGVANFQGANVALSIEDLPAPNAITWIHVAGLLQLPKLDGQPLADYLASVKAVGGRVSANLSRNTRDPTRLFPVLPYLDMLFLNKDEARDITGQVGVGAADHLKRLGAKSVFVTSGPDGASVATPTETFEIQAFPPDTAPRPVHGPRLSVVHCLRATLLNRWMRCFQGRFASTSQEASQRLM